jgi:hypothetical protein
VLATSGALGYKNGECWFGVPHHSFSCGIPMTTIPERATHFHFLLGGNAVALVEAFSQSHWATTATTLTLGASDADHPMAYDYRDSVAALARGNYPALTRLELGISFSQANCHAIHGDIGDPGPLLKQCPNLRHLTICGSFALHAPLHHPVLESLEICVEDPMTGVQGPPLSPSTIEFLRTARLPHLRETDIDLTCTQ